MSEILSKTQMIERLSTDDYHKLMALSVSITHSYSLAQDAVQSSLLIAWEDYDQIKNKDKYLSWMFTIVRRQSYRQLKFYLNFVPLFFEESNCTVDQDALDEGLTLQFVGCEASQFLKSLPESTRQIFILHYWHNERFTSIARKLGMKVATVRSIHARTLKKMQEKFKEIWKKII